MGNPGIAEYPAHEAMRDRQIDELALPGSVRGRSNLMSFFSFLDEITMELLASLTATHDLRPELDVSRAKKSSKWAATSMARIICTIG